jgi:GTP pyrophosphokinase
MTGTEFAAKLLELAPRLSSDLVARAHDAAAAAHAGQVRRSGDPYLVHCEEVAVILAELRLDSAAVAAGLLHDAVEQGGVRLEDLRREFGDEVADLVDGVTKITGLRFESREREQAENFRKMLLSVVRDIRIILVKLADRLHNMRTIAHLSPEQIERISRETRDIYAPLAGRFGMGRIQRELEDLALERLEPAAYREVSEAVDATRADHDAVIAEITRPIGELLKREGVDAQIAGRVKHVASLRRKMVAEGKRLDQIHDLFAIRIITDTVGDCYRALGLVHTLYAPVHELIKDYIASPKPNGYRSLHTTVVGPRRRMVEIQIRTRGMHEQAEVGIAAHWAYKEGSPGDEDLRKRIAWVRQLLEGNVDVTEASEFLDALKVDLYRDEIFVFTPRGDLKELPKGATPLDFAYAVHTGVGSSCAGARVNGRLAPLKHVLESGDTVEIITSDSARPSRDWLSIVTTSRAKNRIRHYLREQADGESVMLGRRIIEREIRKAGPAARDLALDDVAQSLGFDGAEDLAAAVGRGDLGVTELARKLRPVPEPPAGIVGRIARRVGRRDAGVRIDGIGDVMVHFAKCCQPLPGDQIVGIITRGRGVSVHRVDCPNTFAPCVDGDHRIRIEWDVERGQTFPAAFTVTGSPRRDFLTDVSKAVSDQGVEVTSASLEYEDGLAVARFEVEVGNLHRLRKLIRAVSTLRGVRSVERRRSDAGPGAPCPKEGS